jgi:hypothetical protein
MSLTYLFIGGLIILAVYLGIRVYVRMSQRFSGERVIVCPETQQQAMVEVDTRRAALTTLVGRTDLRLESCWRWPLREDCGQECLLQLDVASSDCLVRSVLEKWYRGKKCAFCKQPIDEIGFVDHKPALLGPDGITLEWTEVPFSSVTEAMSNDLPVCWNCHTAQTFRREHPDLVVERPPIVSQALHR